MNHQMSQQHQDQRPASGLTSSTRCEGPFFLTDVSLGWQTGKFRSRCVREKRRLPPPVQSNLMFHESRYKTELCRQFEELGECEYGTRCLFAHGMDELKNIPHRHPKFKTEKCSAYFENGFCSFGPRCSFIHEKVDTVQILLRLQESVKQSQAPDALMDRLMHEAAVLPAVTDSGRRLPVFTRIAPI